MKSVQPFCKSDTIIIDATKTGASAKRKNTLRESAKNADKNRKPKTAAYARVGLGILKSTRPPNACAAKEAHSDIAPTIEAAAQFKPPARNAGNTNPINPSPTASPAPLTKSGEYKTDSGAKYEKKYAPSGALANIAPNDIQKPPTKYAFKQAATRKRKVSGAGNPDEVTRIT